jgi:lipoate-protein ligase A
MELRLLGTGRNNAAMNMAIDEAIMLSRVPTLRFYGWQPPAISIGYFQSMTQEVDLEKCGDLGVDTVRRLTGGGAVFHDNELTYSIIVPEDFGFSKNIIKSYAEICGLIIAGLQKLGLDAEFKPINDIISNGRKISGNAQTRRGGMILQHGTILLDVDVKKMFALLKVPNEKIRDKMISAVEERVTSVNHELGTASFEQTRNAVIDAFMDSGYVLKKEELSAAELKPSKELEKSRSSSNEGNYMS